MLAPFQLRTQARLLWRSSLLLQIYALQATALLTLVMFSFNGLSHIAWQALLLQWLELTLLLLPIPGALAGWGLWRFFHTAEEPLYLNFGLSIQLRTVIGWLSLCLLSGLGSAVIWLLRLRWSEFKAAALNFIQQCLHSMLTFWTLAWPWLLLGTLLLCLALVIYGLTTADPENTGTPDAVTWHWQIDSVVYAYKDKRVLRGTWFSVRSREIVGILGRNGCGKSTLLRLMVGALRQQQGVQHLNGIFLTQAFQVPGLVGWLPQAGFLPPRLKVWKACRWFSASAHFCQDPLIQRIWRQRVGSLSGGEKRFLELGLLLALPRAFYLLDEPFSELAPLQKQQVARWLQLASQQAGLIITDHDYHQILQLSTRVCLMHAGQISAVQSEADLARWYLPE